MAFGNEKSDSRGVWLRDRDISHIWHDKTKSPNRSEIPHVLDDRSSRLKIVTHINLDFIIQQKKTKIFSSCQLSLSHDNKARKHRGLIIDNTNTLMNNADYVSKIIKITNVYMLLMTRREQTESREDLWIEDQEFQCIVGNVVCQSVAEVDTDRYTPYSRIVFEWVHWLWTDIHCCWY